MRRFLELLARVTAPFRPEPGTTEGAVMLGLLLLAGGLALSGHFDWALAVPGVVLVILGSGPFIAGIRKGG